jgi:creatinine amidohydrolase
MPGMAAAGKNRGAMAVFQLEKMTWVQVERLEKARTVLFLPISPIEEHGPHLPLGTDIFAAQDVAAEAAEIITRQDPQIQAVLAPALPLGCAPVTADFPGTISLRADTLKQVIIDVCSALAGHGFKFMVISNHHMDPAHMNAILNAVEELNTCLDVRIIETCSQHFRHHPASLLEQKGRELDLSDLDMRLEIHADVKETSYILYRRPELCGRDYKQLPDRKIDLREGLRNGKTTFRQMGAASGYIGSPGRASPKIGRIYFDEFSQSVAQMAIGLLKDAGPAAIDPGR